MDKLNFTQKSEKLFKYNDTLFSNSCHEWDLSTISNLLNLKTIC